MASPGPGIDATEEARRQGRGLIPISPPGIFNLGATLFGMYGNLVSTLWHCRGN
ncbi:hypothetical protein ACFLW8_01160 [Chloroflexota bacterium]